MKLEACRNVLRNIVVAEEEEDPFEGLIMIDALQRLNIDYYFQEEIEAILRRQYGRFNSHNNQYDHHDDELHVVALRFRLMRQQGYYVAPGKYILKALLHPTGRALITVLFYDFFFCIYKINRRHDVLIMHISLDQMYLTNSRTRRVGLTKS